MDILRFASVMIVIHVGGVALSIFLIKFGLRLINFGSPIAKIGIAKAHSWRKDHPPHDIEVAKIVGIIYVISGLSGLSFALFMLLCITLLDLLLTTTFLFY